MGATVLDWGENMRKEILDLLRRNQGVFYSGEEIAAKLGVTRSAVWKQIKELRTAGYAIESQPRRGYSLCAIPDRLIENEIREGLKTGFIGIDIHCYDEVDSTNTIAKAMARKGAPAGTIVVAEQQGTGRGRLERPFFSPACKGIWVSLILRPHIIPQDAPKFTLLAAVAVAEAMACFGVAAQIKWPNDILYNGKKMVGILTEMSAEIERVNFVVIGVGINVNIEADDFPPELRELATSMSIVKGEKIPRLKLLQKFLEVMEELVLEVDKNGFREILLRWRKYSITLGEQVKVINLDKSYFVGLAVDIDADGALLVDTENGRERVLAGDVSIRPHNN